VHGIDIELAEDVSAAVIAPIIKNNWSFRPQGNLLLEEKSALSEKESPLEVIEGVAALSTVPDLRGRLAIITGGAKGIGLSTSRPSRVWEPPS